MLDKFRRWRWQYARKLLTLTDELADAKMLTAKVLIQQTAQRGLLPDIRDAEFKVFSEYGDDGIIQYLVRQTRVPRELETFVDFGVESYIEANTLFLLRNNNWRGLIMDGSAKNIEKARKNTIYWRHDLTARIAFITKDNINDLILEAGFSGDIGLLSIDIDGNDYWVWEALEAVQPIIVIAEYNSAFGARRALTIPYDPAFTRHKAHHSGLYWGCSLKALERLGTAKGYALVGSNNAGNNAYFVRRDHLNGLSPLRAEEAHVDSKYREARDESGRLTYLSGEARLQTIKHLPIVDLDHGLTTLEVLLRG
jgi:hypothetical protein